MSDEIEKAVVGEINIDALEAAFAPDETLLIEEEIFILETVDDEEEDAVDLAFQEDEGYW